MFFVAIPDEDGFEYIECISADNMYNSFETALQAAKEEKLSVFMIEDLTLDSTYITYYGTIDGIRIYTLYKNNGVEFLLNNLKM